MDEKQQQHVAGLASLMRAYRLVSEENPSGNKNDAILLEGKIDGYTQALNVMYGNLDANEIEKKAMDEAGLKTPMFPNF